MCAVLLQALIGMNGDITWQPIYIVCSSGHSCMESMISSTFQFNHLLRAMFVLIYRVCMRYYSHQRYSRFHTISQHFYLNCMITLSA